MLWLYRDLLRSMIWRDVRLKFTALHLGSFWAIARPLLMVIVLTTVRNLTNAEAKETLPYPLFLYLGLIFWFYFTDAVVEVSQSIQRDAAVVSKVFFPRLITPMVPVLANLVDLACACVPVIGFMIYYGVVPGWNLLLLPVVLAIIMLLAFSVGLLFACLILFIKDLERVLGLILYLGLFVSPVFHGIEVVPAQYRSLLFANPVTGILISVRACVESGGFPWAELASSVGWSVLLLGMAVWLFRHIQNRLIELL
jgi:lipopolysaccharide transport system permease protein